MKITIGGRPFNPQDFANSLKSAALKVATEAMETRVRAAAASLVDPETGKHPLALAWPTPHGVQLSTSGSEAFSHVLEQRLTNEQILTEPEAPTTPLAYLAHASEDKAIMLPVAHQLLKEGIDVWYDEWEIGAGDSLRRKMDDGLGRCTHFLVLLTETSLKKPWVAEEIDAGFVRKVEGSAKFIPIRHGLSLSALPPLMRGMLSPEISPENEPSIKTLIANILGVSAKPPLGAPRYVRRIGALQHFAPAAIAIAEYFVMRSETAHEMETQVTLADIAEATSLSADDAEIGMHDLEEGGYVKAAGRMVDDIFWPLGPLFVTFDQHFKDWIPVEDARAVAAEMVNGGQSEYGAGDLHNRLGWSVRRMNAALWAVKIGRLAEAHSFLGNSDNLVVSHLIITPATKRAARA